jgi:hypothetical protein
MEEKIPKIIKENCLDFNWDNRKVWEVKAPVEKMKILELSWQFDYPFWHSSLERYVITPNQVFKNPNRYKEQYERIMNSDLSHPIDIMRNKKGLWEILDGLHRLAKAYLLKYDTVNIRKIPESEIINIKK